MDLATIKFAIDVLLFFIKLFTAGGRNKEKMQAYEQVMNEKGLRNVSIRMSAERQLDEIKEAWDAEKDKDIF